MQLLILETSLKGSQLKISSISWIHKGGIVLFQQHLSSYFLNIQDASGKNRSKVQGAKKKKKETGKSVQHIQHLIMSTIMFWKSIRNNYHPCFAFWYSQSRWNAVEYGTESQSSKKPELKCESPKIWKEKTDLGKDIPKEVKAVWFLLKEKEQRTACN